MFYCWRRSVVALVTLAVLFTLLLGPGAAYARPRGAGRPSPATPGDTLTALWAWIAGHLVPAREGNLLKEGWGMDPNGGARSTAAAPSESSLGMTPSSCP